VKIWPKVDQKTCNLIYKGLNYLQLSIAS